MTKLKNKFAVITGGSSGIGLATAKRFVEEGAYVFLTGRRPSELEKAQAAIGKNVTTVQGDVANLADLQAVLMSIYRTLRQRGHNPIQTIVAAVRTYLKTGSLPPLPARTTELG